MYTVCPKCTLTLAVTAADLRAGQGYVRCGRCANVFNALLALCEESGLAISEAPPPREQPPQVVEDRASATVSRPALTDVGLTAAGQSEPAPEPPPAPPPSPPPEPRPSAAPALRLVDSPPRPLPPADTPDDELEVEEYRSTGTFETIVLEGDTFLQTEELIPQEVLDSEIANVSRRVAAARDEDQDDGAAVVEIDLDDDTLTGSTSGAELPREDLPRELAALREATGEFRHEANLTATGIEPDLWRAAPRTRQGVLLAAGSALLLLLLVAQAINHWRNDLATHAAWYGPLSRIAARLGEPLQPNWDLNAYDVRQLGAAMDGGGDHALHVRLSLANRGAQPQALPLLRLTLLDRYGKPVSSGELQPAQYLPAALRGQQMIARDQRIDTEVRVQDPTQQIASFELDVCVAAAGGGVRCAGDTPLIAGNP
jgi:predicted Zn finger-like uncharacterized protein